MTNVYKRNQPNTKQTSKPDKNIVTQFRQEH